jgi:hypothetical protein
LFDIEYKSNLVSESVTMVGNDTQLNINAIKFKGDTDAVKVKEMAAAMNNKVSAESKTQTEVGATAAITEGDEVVGNGIAADLAAVNADEKSSTASVTAAAADTAALHAAVKDLMVQA